ncbi:MAG: AglZ/HisF2 family acetamidino modification protein [Acidimicrobiia bacterium]
MSSGFRPRVIPCLLIDGLGLVKTVKFKERTYLGDPVNTVRIFNEKGADELALLDINASVRGSGPQFDLLAEIASEAFMPLAYGGGITTLDEIREILGLGYEKVVLNTTAASNPGFIDEAARVFGRSTIVVSIDVRRPRFGGPEVVTASGTRKVSASPVDYAMDVARRGAGEILLTSVDRDGTQKGYDIELVHAVSAAVNVPVVACGGAGSVADLGAAVEAGASAAAAGSLFVFSGKHRAVLITYPRDRDLDACFGRSERSGR